MAVAPDAGDVGTGFQQEIVILVQAVAGREGERQVDRLAGGGAVDGDFIAGIGLFADAAGVVNDFSPRTIRRTGVAERLDPGAVIKIFAGPSGFGLGCCFPVFAGADFDGFIRVIQA